ncbi:hypothetical protein SAMN04488072_10694 [Lentibacillus halodurans]|uniref:Uncharacterized protein n=1 Tax=Lentibacillus halodurans TaxID=237679 RepID=A0A1I0XZR5_9BACI|nr:hypothetical protein [Lentibacillus halodurans]SFB05503.1 hypothetical protein SAMN04488072_10694 [Lentibacillus halodurans]
MNQLKYLNFGHIEGFNSLSAENKDLFIDVYKKHISSIHVEKRGEYSETNIKSVYLNQDGNFWTTFKNGTTLTYKTDSSFIGEPFADIGITKDEIANLKNVITGFKNLETVSLNIMEILFQVIQKCSASPNHSSVETKIINESSEIGSGLTFISRLLQDKDTSKSSLDEDIMLPVIEDAIFFMNSSVLSFLNDKASHEPESPDKHIQEGITIFYDYLIKNGLLVKTFKD